MVCIVIAATVLSAGAAQASTTTRDHPRPGTTNKAGAGYQSTATDITASIVVGGLTRTYLVHVPSNLSPAAKVPLLLAFHGSAGSSAGMAAMTGFDQIANRSGFIVAYPQGYESTWNDGRGTSPAALAGVNDVAFVQAVVHQLEATYSIDQQRIYATGFSNGAVFTEYLGCKLANIIAAIAPVAGPIAAPIAATCTSSRPLSVFEVQGTTDPVMPYMGGMVASAVRGSVLSEAATIALWTGRDGCRSTPTVANLPAAANDGTSVVATSYLHCASGTGVDAISVVGGFHRWPGAKNGSGPSTAVVPTSFHVSKAVWRFLRRFTLVG